MRIERYIRREEPWKRGVGTHTHTHSCDKKNVHHTIIKKKKKWPSVEGIAKQMPQLLAPEPPP